MDKALRTWHPGVRAGLVVGGAALVVLVALAARAGLAAPRASIWLTALDVAVGAAFVVAAGAAGGSAVERALMAGVGAAWLMGSFVPELQTLHLTFLVLALLSFPGGRPRGAASWSLICLSVPMGLGVVPQLATSLLFAAQSVRALLVARTEPGADRFPAVASGAVAVALLLSWTAARLRLGLPDPQLALLGYQVVLGGVAVAFPFAVRAAQRSRARLADEILSVPEATGSTGLGGLTGMLQSTLGDPDLQVYRWRDVEGAYIDEHGRRIHPGTERARWFAVDEGETRVAVVAHRSSALDDPPTAAAVAAAVRLAVTHLGLQEEQVQQLRDLEAARNRILAAADGARERAAAELREHVEAPLVEAERELRALRAAVLETGAGAALDVVAGELAAATGEIADLVAGAPPVRLGGGRIVAALAPLAERSPVPVSVDVVEVACSAETETTVFYVVSEALANAVKHAHATRISVTVRHRGGQVVASIADDGIGGADPRGSGLQGLADRLMARNGRLRVDSPTGAGTRVTATIPEASSGGA